MLHFNQSHVRPWNRVYVNVLIRPIAKIRQNWAYFGKFGNGARYGLRLDSERANPGSIRARISVVRIGWVSVDDSSPYGGERAVFLQRDTLREEKNREHARRKNQTRKSSEKKKDPVRFFFGFPLC
jgi:hypothetical protein